jgi:hypothetical protein
MRNEERKMGKKSEVKYETQEKEKKIGVWIKSIWKKKIEGGMLAKKKQKKGKKEKKRKKRDEKWRRKDGEKSEVKYETQEKEKKDWCLNKIYLKEKNGVKELRKRLIGGCWNGCK